MQNSRKKVIILGYIALVLCVLAVTASYAWMSISSTPTVTDLALSVVSDNALELAPDNNGTPGDYSSILDLAELAEVGEPLGQITFVSEDNAFYAPNIGIDGRVDFENKIKLTDANGDILPEYVNKGYIYSCTFWIRTSASYCNVGLTPTIEREDGVLGGGTFVAAEPEWNAEEVKHEETTVEKMVRMAIRVDENDGSKSDWIIYDPAYEEGKETLSMNGGTYEGNNRLIRQNVTTWKETDPVLKDSVIYNSGKFIDNMKGLFSLEPNVSKKVTVYFWVEGQDPDCTNAASGSKVIANLQFCGELQNQLNLNAE